MNINFKQNRLTVPVNNIVNNRTKVRLVSNDMNLRMHLLLLFIIINCSRFLVFFPRILKEYHEKQLLHTLKGSIEIHP